jgi:murein DD-endopeptidase MepM/ murein hydrolase activator NlpD
LKELDEIKNRIQNRRSYSRSVNVEVMDVEQKYSKPSKIYKLSMSILIVLALFLSVAVYAKKDENGKFVNETFGININFASFNKTMNELLNFRVVDVMVNGDQAVSNVPSYVHMGEDFYSNGSSEVTSIDDGVVTYVYSDETGCLVIIENDSGFRSVYSNLLDVSVKVNDRVYFDSVIGVVEEKVKIVFSKDDKKLTYEQVVGLI